MEVYYVNSMQWQEDDVIRAFAKVKELIRANRSIKTITFLVGQQSQFSMLAPLGFTQRQISHRGFSTADGYRVQFHTLRTYHPNYVFVNQQPSEILIPVCISPKDIYKFEDYSDIAYWVIVPWTIDENVGFLSVHRGKDCENGNEWAAPEEVDYRVANAIDWLYGTSYPNEGYHHPNDEDRLKNVAVSLKRMRIPVEYNSIVYYCLNNGFVPSAARKTADYIIRAQSHPMQLRDTYNLANMINVQRNNA